MPELLYVLSVVIGLIALAVVLFLSLRGTLTVGYDGEFFLTFKVLFFNIPLLPIREKRKNYRRSMSRRKAKKIRRLVEKKEERKRDFIQKLFGKKEAEDKKPSDKTQAEAPKEKSDVDIPVKLVARETIDILSAFTEIIAIITNRFTHHLRIRISRFKIRIATSDASLTAVTYGACTGIVNVLLPILRDVENLGLPREENFDISADFVSDTPEIDMMVSFSIRTWHIADIMLRSLLGGMSKYVKRKGGIDKTFDNISVIIG